ncbi:MAG: hypothetical protein L0Z51_11235 [Candidatus Latescibacteria bacterium]|nr:hypothetical protein [Candidatus Latescibacterota bacterium]
MLLNAINGSFDVRAERPPVSFTGAEARNYETGFPRHKEITSGVAIGKAGTALPSLFARGEVSGRHGHDGSVGKVVG